MCKCLLHYTRIRRLSIPNLINCDELVTIHSAHEKGGCDVLQRSFPRQAYLCQDCRARIGGMKKIKTIFSGRGKWHICGHPLPFSFDADVVIAHHPDIRNCSVVDQLWQSGITENILSTMFHPDMMFLHSMPGSGEQQISYDLEHISIAGLTMDVSSPSCLLFKLLLNWNVT